MSDKDIIAEAKEAYRLGIDAESDNRQTYRDDYLFARLNEHWPEDVARLRQRQGRPTLTIPRLPAFIRQVVNDSRQNRPRIRVKPVDNFADPKTAQVLDGLILNIETASNASVAYDTAIDCAVSGGFGYFRIDVEYASDQAFDKELRINRVLNPLQVVGDPYSEAADSSDWNTSFITTLLSKDAFKRRYKGAAPSGWFEADYRTIEQPWLDGDEVMVAEYWTREEVEKTLIKLTDGRVMFEDVYARQAEMLMPYGVEPSGEMRKTKGYKVRQRILTGAEVLEEKDWAGCFIPIIPVYGEELNDGGKRIFRSLIHSAKDAQRRLNYWVSAATELVALAPKTPFIGDERAFELEPDKWATVNTHTHPYIAVPNGAPVPQRQPLDGGQAVGAISQALAASDDIKSILGMYDASLGAKSNETSGKAIMARQREGDTSTFHFIDNLSRAQQHAGRILVDLIPYVYTPGQMVRILGQDGRSASVELRNRMPGEEPPSMQPFEEGVDAGITLSYDFGVGRYDVVVDTGPSYTTRREETAQQMIEMIRSVPGFAPLIGDKLAKNLDWPDAEEISERLKKMLPPQISEQGGIPPEIQQQMQEGMQTIQQLQAENEQLKQSQQTDQAKVQIDAQKAEIEAFKAQTERMVAERENALAMASLQAPPPPAVTPQDVGSMVAENVERAIPVIEQTVAQSVEQVVKPLIEQTVNQAIASIPKPKRMKRVPVRNADGLIVEVNEEPIEDEPNRRSQVLANTIAQTVAQTVASLPKPGRMRRVPVRDKDGLILEVREEPISD